MLLPVYCHAVERFLPDAERTHKRCFRLLNVVYLTYLHRRRSIFRTHMHDRNPLPLHDRDTKRGMPGKHCLHRLAESVQIHITRQFTAHRNVVHRCVRLICALQIDSHLGICERVLCLYLYLCSLFLCLLPLYTCLPQPRL